MEHRQDISDTAPDYSRIDYADLADQKDDTHYKLSVLVSGVHCAGCIQKIESSLVSEQDIDEARLNFSTGRLTFSWHGDTGRANQFIEKVEALGYGVQPYSPDKRKEEQQEEERFLLLCMGVAGFAMGNVMLLSVGVWSSSSEVMGMAMRDFLHWISALIALPVILFSGRPFFRSALQALSAGHTNMDVPISLALILTGGMSLFETLNHGEYVYFDSALMLMFFLLIGRYLDFRARKNARGAASDLLQSFTGTANVIDPETGKTRAVFIRDLKPEMQLRVTAGENFPVDAVILEGDSTVDESLVTGETLPVEKVEGDVVYAGTVNVSRSLTLSVAKAAEDSLLADIVRLMEKAEQGQADYVRLADRAARLYTPVVHSLAALAFLFWIFLGGLEWQAALLISITVLIITCPCALGLAVPVVQVLASGRLMKQGVLVKSGDALERLAVIDTVMFDKTGTLTLGQLQLDGDYPRDILQMAASLASHSLHPLSLAIADAYEGELVEVNNVEEIAGKGIQALKNGKMIRLGSRKWCGDQKQSESDRIELWLDNDGQKTCFYFQDQLKEDAYEVCEALKNDHIHLILASGDRKQVAGQVGESLHITDIYAEHSPTEKSTVLEQEKENGRKVLMVGDGLNDAPVLAGADVSMAPGSAIDMAQNAADIVFMGNKLKPILRALKTAKVTQLLVRQNFGLAIIYNIIAVPIAFAGFVTPMIAALCMSGSSLIVIANSFRLKRLTK